MAAALAQGYGESVLFEGDPPPGAPRVVIAARPDGSTWTALTIAPSGLACIQASGGRWRTGSVPPAGQEG